MWSSECTRAMKTAKQLLTASNLLTHYDATLPLKLAADASQYGLGAVISHVLPDGVERPVDSLHAHCRVANVTTHRLTRKPLPLCMG